MSIFTNALFDAAAQEEDEFRFATPLTVVDVSNARYILWATRRGLLAFPGRSHFSHFSPYAAMPCLSAIFNY